MTCGIPVNQEEGSATEIYTTMQTILYLPYMELTTSSTTQLTMVVVQSMHQTILYLPSQELICSVTTGQCLVVRSMQNLKS